MNKEWPNNKEVVIENWEERHIFILQFDERLMRQRELFDRLYQQWQTNDIPKG